MTNVNVKSKLSKCEADIQCGYSVSLNIWISCLISLKRDMWDEKSHHQENDSDSKSMLQKNQRSLQSDAHWNTRSWNFYPFSRSISTKISQNKNTLQHWRQRTSNNQKCMHFNSEAAIIKVQKIMPDNRNLSWRNKDLSKSRSNEYRQNSDRSEWYIKAENKEKRENSDHEVLNKIVNSQMKNISETL